MHLDESVYMSFLSDKQELNVASRLTANAFPIIIETILHLVSLQNVNPL